MPGSERKPVLRDFTGEMCESRQTRGQKTLGWPTNPSSFLDVVHLRRLSPACTTSQIAANVWQQPAATAGLPAVFLRPPSACGSTHPVAVPQPARHPLQPAVQRQPDGPQPHRLTGLHPRSLLPASDRSHQGDGHPRARRPLTVCGQGARLLHRGQEGKFMRFSFSCHKKFHKRFPVVAQNEKSFPRNYEKKYKGLFSSRAGHTRKYSQHLALEAWCGTAAGELTANTLASREHAVRSLSFFCASFHSLKSYWRRKTPSLTGTVTVKTLLVRHSWSWLSVPSRVSAVKMACGRWMAQICASKFRFVQI